MQRVVSDDEKPHGHPRRDSRRVAGAIALFPSRLQVIETSNPVLCEHDVLRQPEAVDTEVRPPDNEHREWASNQKERKRVDGRVHDRRYVAVHLVPRHPVGLGDVVADQVEDKLDHLQTLPQLPIAGCSVALVASNGAIGYIAGGFTGQPLQGFLPQASSSSLHIRGTYPDSCVSPNT